MTFGDGTTSQDTSPVHIFPSDGVYEVCLIVCNQNACDTLCQTITIGTSAALEPQKLGELEISPNPSNAIFWLSMPNSTESASYQAHLINVLGQTVKKTDFKGSQTAINVSDISSGLYLVQIIEKRKKRAVGKVIIAH